MEVIIWNKGVQDVQYYCDSCKAQVSEEEGLWVNGEPIKAHEYPKGFCRSCYMETRRKVTANE